MAPKNKKNISGFTVFTGEWKRQYGKTLSFPEAVDAAGVIWKNMTEQQRGPYNEKAKMMKIKQEKSKKLLLTTVGIPVEHVKKEREELEDKERSMKRYIEGIVRNSAKEGDLDIQKVYFISANYFTKSMLDGIYLPAEISVSEFCLKKGVMRTYHSFINPGSNIYGHHYDALQHSESTHKLPLPPKALGESNMAKVFDDILQFIYDEENAEFPPLYTTKDSIHVVESILDYLKSDNNADVKLSIYSIQYLFFVMKCAAADLGENRKPASYFVAEAQFDRDFFEFQTGLACDYHEENDRAKYCTLSCVIRWGYTFADYMCHDVAVTLLPGLHVPVNTNLSAITKKPPKDEPHSLAWGGSSASKPPSYASSIKSERESVSETVTSSGRCGSPSSMGSMESRNCMYSVEFPPLLGKHKPAGPSTKMAEASVWNRRGEDPKFDNASQGSSYSPFVGDCDYY